MNADLGDEKAGRVRVIERHEESAVGGALSDHDVFFKIGIRRHADAATLADRVVVEAAMLSEERSIRGTNDWAGFVGYVLAEKILHLHFADKTNTLAVLLSRGYQSGFAGDAA